MQERIEVFVRMCLSTRTKREEFWLPVREGVVALQEVAGNSGEILDMQGAR